MVQDTAWKGYMEVPAWIVEGYQTMLHEIDEAVAELDAQVDLVAVPVGSGRSPRRWCGTTRRPGDPHPSVLSVEPDAAACVLESLSSGKPETVATGATVMAGLDCGTVSAPAWPVLRAGCDAAVAVTDDEASRAVEDLAARRLLGP